MPTPGPAPKPADQRRRRNQPTFPTTRIPAAGRGDRPAPAWPAGVTSRKPPKAMAAIWEQLWAKPQAKVWEEQRLEDVVARYCVMRHRQMTSPDGELKKFAAEVRMLEDRLGMNSAAMLKLRWEIVTDEPDADDRPLASVSPIRRVAAVDPADAAAEPGDDDTPEDA